MRVDLLLTGFGAIGGFVLVYQATRAFWTYVRRRLAARGRHSKTHYYSRVEVSCRWLQRGKHYVAERRLTVVSESNPLAPFRIGFGPATLASWRIRSVDGPFTLRSVPPEPPGPDWLDYMVDPTYPLTKGQSASLHIEYEAEALPGVNLPEFWMFVSESRVDELLLRVVFDEPLAQTPRFRICSQAGTAFTTERLEFDRISRECKKELRNLRPGMHYIIDWPESSESLPILLPARAESGEKPRAV